MIRRKNLKDWKSSGKKKNWKWKPKVTILLEIRSKAISRPIRKAVE